MLTCREGSTGSARLALSIPTGSLALDRRCGYRAHGARNMFRAGQMSPALTLSCTRAARPDAAGVRPGEPRRLKLLRERRRVGLVREVATGHDPVAGQDAVGGRRPPVLTVVAVLLQPLDHALGILHGASTQDGGGPENAGWHDRRETGGIAHRRRGAGRGR